MKQHRTVLLRLIFALCALTMYLADGYTEEAKTTIGIFTFEGAGRPTWDPDSINNGIAGSEEAVIYLSEELAKLGYQVTIYANPPEGSKFSQETANPRYLPAKTTTPPKIDIAISSRMPMMGVVLKKYAPQVYLWPHDTFPWHIPQEQIDSYSDVLWLTKWERENWIQFNSPFAKFTNIYGNGINLSQFEPVKEREKPYACIYGSNYSRGLKVLLDTWPAVNEKFPEATLDIYYGWNHWGTMSPADETALREQVKTLGAKGVNEHGLVGHEELHRAFSKASLWTYPCTAQETFCITAIKAQASGAVPVIIDGTALKETVRHGYKCDKPEEYLQTLLKAMNDVKMLTLDQRKQMRNFVEEEYSWQKIAEKWHAQFQKDRLTLSEKNAPQSPSG